MTDHVATVENVSVTVGELPVLEDVRFGVESGGVTCLIGPNGSGKTTLLRVVAGLLAPDVGTVERTVSSARPVGYLAQEPAFRPQFTVRETLQFYADLVGEGTDVEAAIDRVGLGGVPDRSVDALSGGMTRLLGIAQATLGDPGLLVLDEPSSGLDPMMTRHITDVVSDLATDGRGVVLATHDLASVERVADSVVVLDRGHVVASDTPAGILAETGTDSLDAAMPALVSAEAGEISTRGPTTASVDGEGDSGRGGRNEGENGGDAA